jgi:hypothetical protein
MPNRETGYDSRPMNERPYLLPPAQANHLPLFFSSRRPTIGRSRLLTLPATAGAPAPPCRPSLLEPLPPLVLHHPRPFSNPPLARLLDHHHTQTLRPCCRQAPHTHPHCNPKVFFLAAAGDTAASHIIPISGEVLASPPPVTPRLRRPCRWRGLRMFLWSSSSDHVPPRPPLTGRPTHMQGVCGAL